MVFAAGLCDIGCKRQTNQDRILISVANAIFAVADGMGGQSCGERAAELAIATLAEYFLVSPTNGMTGYDTSPSAVRGRLAAAILHANDRVFQEAQAFPECAGMGSTVSALYVESNQAVVGSVGDSRVYLYRSGTLLQLTRDDSIVAGLLASGEIDAQQGLSHPMRNVLTQCVGICEALDVELVALELQTADRLILCSDGLHSVIDHGGIREVMSEGREPEHTVRRFVQESRQRGAPDNISCIIVEYR